MSSSDRIERGQAAINDLPSEPVITLLAFLFYRLSQGIGTK
jgi:hypothetical protein